MQYTVSTSGPINWNAKGHARILQNVANLLSLFTYEVAYMRTLGLGARAMDEPAQRAASRIMSDAADLIAEEEPRAVLKSIELIEADTDGNLAFQAEVEIR